MLAAEMPDLTEAPVIVLGHLTDEQRRAYRIADNKLTELGEWDEAVLSEELKLLAAEEFDLSLIGFDDGELDALLSGLDEETDDDEDEVPEPPEDPISRPGDLWVLGKHRLLCGDATVVTDVEKLLGDQKADLCFCDPPYNVDYAGGAGADQAGKARRIKNDALGDGFGQLMPKSTDLSDANQTWLNEVAALMNNRPRKTLGWKTPTEAMAREIAAFKSTIALEN